MVENYDARGSRLHLHQGFHFRVIDPAHIVLVQKIANLRVMGDEAETVAIEHEFGRMRAAVVDGDLAGIGLAARAHLGRARPARVGVGHLTGIQEIVDGRLDGIGDRIGRHVLLDDVSHWGAPSDSKICAQIWPPNLAPRSAVGWAKAPTENFEAADNLGRLCPRGVVHPRGQNRSRGIRAWQSHVRDFAHPMAGHHVRAASRAGWLPDATGSRRPRIRRAFE